jgi:hypothetical protein
MIGDILFWRGAKKKFKAFRKISRGIKSNLIRNFLYIELTIFQQAAGPLESYITDKFRG